MRIGFAGTPEPAVATLKALLASHHDVAVVVTRTDAPVGRGKVMTPSPVAQLAQTEGLRTVKLDSLREVGDVFVGLDLVVVVAYGALVPVAQLTVPAHGFLNVHYSLLPRWRGAAPVQHAILAGDSYTGVTVFELDEGLDTGRVLATASHELRGDETSGSLLDSLTVTGAELLLRVLADIESGTADPQVQQDAGATYASKIATVDARIDWTQPATHIDRLARAMWPHPGAWAMCGDERIKFEPVRVVASRALVPGQVTRDTDGIVVGTGDGAVLLSRVQRAGRTMVDAAQWYESGVVLS